MRFLFRFQKLCYCKVLQVCLQGLFKMAFFVEYYKQILELSEIKEHGDE